jgi:hypothetical protein
VSGKMCCWVQTQPWFILCRNQTGGMRIS